MRLATAPSPTITVGGCVFGPGHGVVFRAPERDDQALAPWFREAFKLGRGGDGHTRRGARGPGGLLLRLQPATHESALLQHAAGACLEALASGARTSWSPAPTSRPRVTVAWSPRATGTPCGEWRRKRRICSVEGGVEMWESRAAGPAMRESSLDSRLDLDLEYL